MAAFKRNVEELEHFDDVPEKMIGIYDVVHVRLLVLVVQRNDIAKYVSK